MPHKFPTFPNLITLADKFKGVLLDAYGVFWNSNDCGLFPGALTAMDQLVKGGKIVGILSNSTQIAAKEIHKLHGHGLIQNKHFHFFITSGEVARSIFLSKTLPFATPNNAFWLFGTSNTKFSSYQAVFANTKYSQTLDVSKADFIYLSVPHINGEDQTDPELFREAVKKNMHHKLPMICTNPDLFAHEGNPPKPVVRQGTIAKFYEEMGGTVFYIGKPYGKAYSLSMQEFLRYGLVDPASILMVGDTPETDIRGARNIGMPSALITHTGIMADRISLMGLEIALDSLPNHDIPNFLLERFADGISSSS